jgi:RNAse (barnase) inhibitor barstar
MELLNAILHRSAAPGMYRYRGRAHAQSICEEVAEHGFRCFYLDGRSINDKATFLSACGAAMSFPAYYGRNWDALDECITDLDWCPAPGYVLLYDDVAHFARNEPEQWSIALDILREAANHWRDTATPMYILLRGTRGSTPDVPVLELTT